VSEDYVVTKEPHDDSAKVKPAFKVIARGTAELLNSL